MKFRNFELLTLNISLDQHLRDEVMNILTLQEIIEEDKEIS